MRDYCKVRPYWGLFQIRALGTIFLIGASLGTATANLGPISDFSQLVPWNLFLEIVYSLFLFRSPFKNNQNLGNQGDP